MDLTKAEARELLGEVGARPPGAADPEIDGLTPSLILEPSSVAAAGRALAFCQQERLAVVPLGAGTRLHLGNLPSRLDVYLSTRGLAGVFDYEPGDLTVSAGAGTTLRELQVVVGAERQLLPWDVPLARRATLGGILAAGDPGFRRRPGARPRDLLLGVEALCADGTRVKAGGRVVKNVAGYEVTKLLVGSLGTLGLLTRLHLRLRPRPEMAVTLAVSLPDGAEADRALRNLRSAAVDPEVMAAANPSVASEVGLSGWAVLMRFEGREEEVRAGAARAKELIRAGESEPLTEVQSEKAWETLYDFPSPDGRTLYQKILRVQALPSEVLSLAQGFPGDCLLLAFPDAGLVYVRLDEREHCRRIAAFAAEHGANVVLEAVPPDWKSEVDVFGEPPGGLTLMRSIKNKLDPRGILAPGRFVGRL